MAKYVSVDASTNSFAFAVWDSGVLLEYGKLNFVGANPTEKALDAARKVQALMSQTDADYMVIEAAIFANSASVAMALGVAQGAIMAAARLGGIERMVPVAPITWQSYIGNKNFTKAEKLQIRRDYPGRTTSWYRTFERGIRKQKTMDFVNKHYGLEIVDNDIGDAIGLGYYAHQAVFALRPKKEVKKQPVKRNVKKMTKRS